MSLDLSARQRAMLQEMGVRVWSPPPSQADSATASPKASAPATPPTRPQAFAKAAALPNPAPGVADVAPAPVNPAPGPDWAALGQAVANCQACPLSVGRRAPVWGGRLLTGPAELLVLGAPPNLNEESAGHPFAGEEGMLLDHMLHVMGRRRDATDPAHAVYLSNVVKCRPDTPRLPEAAELAACASHLQHEIALVQPQLILTMGRLAALSLLQHAHPEVLHQPLGQIRGRLYRYHNIAVVTTYPPNSLLRNGPAKAGAWADLCLALDELARRRAAARTDRDFS